ncbi:MAG: hypothetical protein EHM64_14440 [Ignavibacteriae bacterium]|nr:MAG: hypothetical protein EHM64_14440 [Ignavibacteriota bacterium]
MNQSLFRGFLCAILLYIPMDYAVSQDANQTHPWWVNLGAGPALIGKTFAMNGGMVYCRQFDHSLISARILGMTNNNPTVQRIERSSPVYKMADYGVLYGPVWQTDVGTVTAGAGIGLVRAAYEMPASITTNSSISIPIEIQWFWRFTNYAGLCIYTYTSLNFEKPLSGVLICAQLGVW